MNEARVAYFTDKFDETLAWWRDGVGLELLEHWDRDDSRGAILVVAPGIVVEFMAAPHGAEPWSPPARDAFTLAIPTSDPKPKRHRREEIESRRALVVARAEQTLRENSALSQELTTAVDALVEGTKRDIFLAAGLRFNLQRQTGGQGRKQPEETDHLLLRYSGFHGDGGQAGV